MDLKKHISIFHPDLFKSNSPADLFAILGNLSDNGFRRCEESRILKWFGTVQLDGQGQVDLANSADFREKLKCALFELQYITGSEMSIKPVTGRQLQEVGSRLEYVK